MSEKNRLDEAVAEMHTFLRSQKEEQDYFLRMIELGNFDRSGLTHSITLDSMQWANLVKWYHLYWSLLPNGTDISEISGILGAICRQLNTWPRTERIFLSVSYSAQVDADGNVTAEYRNNLEMVITTLETGRRKVFCAPREDEWRLNDRSPGEALRLDLEHIDGCDVFVAILGSTISVGIQLELGYAIARGKRIILAVPAGTSLAYINQGVRESPMTTLVEYHDFTDLVLELLILT